MTAEEQAAADAAAAEKAKADKEAAAEKAKADKAAADAAAAEKAKADKEAAAEKAKADKAAADAAAAEKKAAKKKTIADLKSTDDVVVAFKNPVHVSEDGENKVDKEQIVQHVKYAYWLGLKKDDKGNPVYSTLRGAKLIGYVEDGKTIEFK